MLERVYRGLLVSIWCLLAAGLTRGQEPGLPLATYLGGFGSDEAWALAKDAEGNVYLGGSSSSQELAGFELLGLGGGSDALVVKLSPELDDVLMVNAFGGFGADGIREIAVRADGMIVVAGFASTGFPTTRNVIQEDTAGAQDLFVAVLEPEELEIEYATVYGGSAREVFTRADLRSDGVVSILGYTESPNFPVSDGAFQSRWGGGASDTFVVQILPDGDLPTAEQLVYSTLLGGNARDDNVWEVLRDIEATEDGRITVFFDTQSTDLPLAGNSYQRSHGGNPDGFVAILDPGREGPQQLIYSTYLGGPGWEEPRWVRWLDERTLILAGETSSTSGFPWTETVPFAGYSDIFVTTLDIESGNVEFSTRFGGRWWDLPQRFLMAESGDVVAVGVTGSSDFPRVNGFGEFGADELSHGFLFAFRPGLDGSPSALRYSTSLGTGGGFSSLSEVVRGLIEEAPGVYLVVGHTDSPSLPVTDDALQTQYAGGPSDIVLARIDTRPQKEALFVRGDSNGDGTVNINDPVHTLQWLFGAGEEPPCLDAAESDDSGRIELSDAVVTLNWLFAGSLVAPQAPFPDCGSDPTQDDLGCERFPPCDGG